MNSSNPRQVSVSRPKITLSMMICGLVSAASMGAVSAATAADAESPQIAIHYDAQALSTEVGARSVYRQIVTAAALVCPANNASGPFVNPAVRQCRVESIARAVHSINNQRLAEVLANSRLRGG